MSAPLFVGAWLLSVLPFLLVRLSGGALEIEGASRLGLALLPWLALAGFPRRGDAGPGALRFSGWIPVVALALPPVALGAALDLQAGGSPLEVLWRAGVGLALVAGLALAADAARDVPRARPWHAGAWLVLVPGSAALCVALTWLGAPGKEPVAAPLAELFRWNPLVLAHAIAGGAASVPATTVLRVALAVVLLAVVPLALGRGRDEEGWG